MGATEGFMKAQIDRLKKENERLKEDNKNLRLIQETNEKQIQNDINERDELREENQKLKEYNGELIKRHKEETDLLCKEISNLQEQIRFNT